MNAVIFNNLIERSEQIYQDNQHLDMRQYHMAYVLNNGRIISTGVNKRKTHPRIQKHPYRESVNHLHAELDAIIRLGKEDCAKYELVVIRIKRSGGTGYSKPCSGCMSAITQAGFKNIYYSLDNDDFERLIG